jgi:PII-like signaling protein
MKKLEGTRKLLRVYINEKDASGGKPLYKAIVDLCMEKGIAGATVTRGIYGYGRNKLIHSARTLVLSGDLPMIVEIVDTEEQINMILPHIDEIMQGGLITVELAHVLKYE